MSANNMIADNDNIMRRLEGSATSSGGENRLFSSERKTAMMGMGNAC